MIEKKPSRIPYHKPQMPLVSAFQKTAMVIRATMRAQLQGQKWLATGFKPPCIGAMHGIGRLAPVSQKDLSKWMMMDPADIVSVIDLLEEAGYVNRTRDVSDRRRQLLSLTRKGEEARKKLTFLGEEVMKEVLTPLSEKEIETLRKLLERVATHHNEFEK